MDGGIDRLRHVPMRQRESGGDHQGGRSDNRGQGLPRLPACLLAPALDLSIEPCPFGLSALLVGGQRGVYGAPPRLSGCSNRSLSLLRRSVSLTLARPGR
jgi:hypothetical protein